MAKQLNVNVAVTADTAQARAQLNQLQKTLTQLTSNSANLKVGINSSEIAKATADVNKLAVYLKDATNQSGMLDFSKLSQNIKQNGSTLKEYGESLLKLGPQGQQAFTQLTQAIAKSEVPMNRLKGILGEFGTVLGNTIKWQMASSAIHGMMGSIQHAFSYAQQLNQSLNNIQIVTQASSEHMAKFAEQANKAAKELNTTTTRYTNASLIYYQQGLSDQEVAERTATTIKMANVSGQSAEKVSNQLTAIWNNFAKGSTNLEYYADVITALGAATASSSEEIATGLEKFASIANTVGLSYENATAALATITATTRQSADTVGTGLRTLFGRLQSLSLGETLDDGVTLTKYSKALETIGVKVIDTSGSLREMDDILADMGAKWNSLTDAQKTATAQTVGGVRQYATIMALMDNFDVYQKNLRTAQNSEGTIQAQAEIYAKSWEASQKRVKAASESLYSDLIDDNFFIALNNGFAGILNIIDSIVDGLGGMKAILPGIAAILTQLFSGSIATGLVNFSTALASLKPGAAAQFRAERQSFLENATNTMLGIKDRNSLSNTQRTQLGFAENEIKFQQAYLANQGVMSSTDKQLAQMHMDRYSNLRQAYTTTQQDIYNSQAQARNARGTMVSGLKYEQDASWLDYDKKILADMEKTNRARANAKYANLKRVEDAWFDNNGIFQRNQWLDDFNAPTKNGKTAVENFTTKIDEIESKKNILKELFTNGMDGAQELEKKWNSMFKDESFQSVLDNIIDAETGAINESDLNKTLTTYTEQQQMQIQDFAAQWGLNENAVQKYAQAIIAASGHEEKLKQIAAQIKLEEEQATEAVNKRSKAMVNAQNITQLAQGTMSLAAAAGATSGFADNIQSILSGQGSLSAGIGLFTSLGSAAFSAVSGFTAITTALKAMGGALGAAAGPIGWIITIASVAIPLITKIIDTVLETPDEKIERLTEESNEASNAAQNASAAYDELLNKKAQHADLLNTLEGLTAETNRFKEALQEANALARDIITTHGLKYGTDYTYENGLIRFADGLLENVEAQEKQFTQQAQINELIASFTTSMAQEQKSNAVAIKEGQDAWAEFVGNDTTGAADFIDQVYRGYFNNLELSRNITKNGIPLSELENGSQEALFLAESLDPRRHSQEEISNFLTSHLEYRMQDYTSSTPQTLLAAYNHIWDNQFKQWQAGGIGGVPTFQPDTYTNFTQALNSAYTVGGQELTEATEKQDNRGISQYANILSELAYQDTEMSTAEEMAIRYLTDKYNSDIWQQKMNDIEKEVQKEYNNKKDIDELEKQFADLYGEEQLALFKSQNDYLTKDEAAKKKAIQDYVKQQKQSEAINVEFNNAVEKLGSNQLQQYYIDLKKLTVDQLQNLETFKSEIQGDQALARAEENLAEEFRNSLINEMNNIASSIFGEETTAEGYNLDIEQWRQVKELNTDFKSIFQLDKDDTRFIDELNKQLFTDNKSLNKNLANALSHVDLTSSLSALFNLKELESEFGTQVSELYNIALDSMGGEVGILSDIFQTDDFKKDLKKLQKEFYKTGKLTTQDIEDIATSCDTLTEALDLNILSAGAVADAIELYSMGAIDNIDSITQELWNALKAANAFEDGLASAFDYIDNKKFDRSTQDIADWYGKTAKDFQELLGQNRFGDERLFQEAAVLWNPKFAEELRADLATWSEQYADNPEGFRAAYQTKYGVYDDVYTQVQKEGNMGAWWRFVLNPQNANNLMGVDQGALRDLGLSYNTNKQDIEYDFSDYEQKTGRRMTSTELATQFQQIFGLEDFEQAQAMLYEFAGASGSLASELKVNDTLQALDEVKNGKYKDINPEDKDYKQRIADAKQRDLQLLSKTLDLKTLDEAITKATAEKDWDRVQALQDAKKYREDAIKQQEKLLEAQQLLAQGDEEAADAKIRESNAIKQITADAKTETGALDYDTLIENAQMLSDDTATQFETIQMAAADSAKGIEKSFTDAWGNVQKITISADEIAGMKDMSQLSDKIDEEMTKAVAESNAKFGEQFAQGFTEAFVKKLGELKSSLDELNLDGLANLASSLADADTATASITEGAVGVAEDIGKKIADVKEKVDELQPIFEALGNKKIIIDIGGSLFNFTWQDIHHYRDDLEDMQSLSTMDIKINIDEDGLNFVKALKTTLSGLDTLIKTSFSTMGEGFGEEFIGAEDLNIEADTTDVDTIKSALNSLTGAFNIAYGAKENFETNLTTKFASACSSATDSINNIITTLDDLIKKYEEVIKKKQELGGDLKSEELPSPANGGGGTFLAGDKDWQKPSTQKTTAAINIDGNLDKLTAKIEDAEYSKEVTLTKGSSEEIDGYIKEVANKTVNLLLGANQPQTAINALPTSHSLDMTVNVSVGISNAFGSSITLAGGAGVIGSMGPSIQSLAAGAALSDSRTQAFIEETRKHYTKGAEGCRYSENTLRGSALGGGTYHSYVNGSANRFSQPGISLTAEEGPEIIWNKQEGYSYIVGGHGHPEFVNLRPGDRVFNANDTRKILNYNRPKSNFNSAVIDPRKLNDKLFMSNAGSVYNGGVGPKASSSGGKSRGSGSGGADKQEDPERYHYISRQIEDATRWTEKLAKAKEHAYGTNILDAIDREITAIDKLIQKNKDLLKEVNNYLKEDYKKLLEYGVNVELDEYGNIKNWSELEDKYKINIPEGIDNAEEIWKAIEQYEETVDKLHETQTEIEDLVYERAEKMLERITTKVEIRVDIDDTEIKLLDHYIKKIDDDIFSSAKVLDLVQIKYGKIVDQINTTKTGISEIFQNLTDEQGNTILNPKTKKAYTLEDILKMSEAERDALHISQDMGEQLEKYANDLIGYLDDLEEFKTKGVEELSEAFDKLNENVTSQIGLFEHYTTMLQNFRDIADLQGLTITKEMRETIKNLNNAMLQVNKNDIQSQQNYYKELQTIAGELENKIANTTDTTLSEKYKEELDKVKEQMRTTEEEILTLWQDGLNKAKEMFEDAMEEAKEEYGKSLSDMYGNSSLLQQAYDRKSDLDSEYADDYEKYYKLGKLQRSIIKDIDSAALNGNKANKNLKKLLEEIQDLQESGTELSVYDLDILEKKYEYEKALADLEDQRNAKSIVRLQRDNNGNWGYVFTAADDDELADKEQAVEDKLYEYTKAATEQSKNLQSQILSLWSKAGDEIAQMRADGVSQDVIDDYINDTQQKLDFLTAQLEKTGTDVSEALPKWIERTNDSFNLTTDTFEETILSAVTGMDSVMAVGSTITDAIGTIAISTKEAVEDYENLIDVLNNIATMNEKGFVANSETFANMIVDTSEATRKQIDDGLNQLDDTYTKVLNKATEFENTFLATYKDVIDNNETLLENLLKILDPLNKLEIANNNIKEDLLDKKILEEAKKEYEEAVAAAAAAEAANDNDNGGGGGGGSGSGDGGNGSNGSGGTNRILIVGNDTPIASNTNPFSNDKGEDNLPSSNSNSIVADAVQQAVIKFASAFSVVKKFDEGGYTGSWGADGRLAILHEQENVFNKEDTSRLLDAAIILRTIDTQAKWLQNGIGFLNTPSIQMNQEPLEQNVYIEASFPNAVNHNEIEEAFNNLANKATQYANRKMA